MKRKLLFITLLMLFCSTMFGQQHWQMTEADIVNYNLTMTVYADVTFNTDPLGDLDETKYEIAAFHNGVLRGVATPTYSEKLKRYTFRLIVHSKEIGQTISFKFFNPKEGPEGTVYNTDYTVNFSNGTVGMSLRPITIDFYEPYFDFDAPSSVENYMGFGCAVKIDGVEQNRPNLEIAAFKENGEVCGYARSQALVGTNIYIYSLQIYAQNGETISFKLFDPTIGEDGDVLSTDYTIKCNVNYDSEAEIVYIDFKNNAVAQIGNNYYTTLEAALAATMDNDVVTIIKSTNETIGVPAGNNVTIKALEGVELSGGAGGSYYNKSVTFDGLTFKGGKGIALTAGVDGITYTVKNCTFDGVQATAWKQGVISLNGNATVVVENNIITDVKNATEGDGRIDSEGQQSTGIYTNNAVEVTISGNTITNVDGTGISSNSNAGEVDIKDNKISAWGTGATAKNEGRAIRTSGGTEVAITGNVMIDNGTAKEEFVKATGMTVSFDASGNYWSGKNPLEEGIFDTDFAKDPAQIIDNYYTDAEKSNLVELAPSVAKIGDTYYATLKAALKAATEGCSIDLLADVEVSEPLNVSSNSAFDKINVTFNGNGKTIKAVGNTWNDNIWLADIAWNVTLNNVTFDGNNTGCKGVQFYTSTSTLNNITVKNVSADKWNSTDYAIHANASELTVTGSLNFEGCKHGMLMVDLGSNTGKVASVVSIADNATVNGVKVILNHKDASMKAPETAAAYVLIGNVEGYTMVYENGSFKLVEAVAKIGDTYYATLEAALNAAQPGETVTILAGDYTTNITINKAITVEGERDDNNNNLVTFNGKLNITANGAIAKNLNVNNGGSTAGYINAKDVLVEGCDVTGGNGFYYCYTAGTVTFKDSKITGATYGIHFDGSAGGNIVIDNCDITGWTSFAGTITNVAITNTEFLNGNYNQLRFYQNAQMTNCKFNEEMTIDFGMNDVNAEFEGCAVVDTEGNATDAPLTDVIYLGDIAEMGVDVTINSEPVIVEAKVADNNGDNASYFLVFLEALNAAQANQTVTVLQDITLEQTATIAEGKTVVLDLNGKTINAGWENESDGKHIYAFTNNGTLTIKDSSTEANGTINARGNFNYGTMTLVNGTINAIDGNGGYGVRNYSGASFTMNAGTIATTLEDDNKVDKGGYDATPVCVDEGATFTMNGGTINNICDFTVAIDNYGTTTIEGGTFTSVHTTVINHGTMTIDGGTFTCNGLEGITAHALLADAGTTTINGGTFNGKDNYNGFNVDASEGATVYITGGNFLPVHSGSLYGKGTIAVSGGTFFDDVTEFCAEGFTAKPNAYGTYDVRFADYIVLPTGMNESNYETLFGTNTVTDGTNYYATLQAAVESVVGTESTLYCKPGSDVGELQHAPVTNTLTVYGNGAFVSGDSERDFDLGNTDPSGGQDITSDMTLTVKYLDGCGAWGTKATEHTVNLVFENCYNMGKAYITGTTGTLNITMTDCAFEGVIAEALYSNADGAITLTNVDFSNLNKAVNLNHKAAGTQTVTMTGCTFTDCGNVVAADQIPVRVLSSVEGGSSVLTVNACTFTGTPEGGADILLDYGVGITTATVSNTVAYVVVEREDNVQTDNDKTTTSAAQTYTFDNRPYVAKVGEVSYKTIAEALAAVQDGGTITLINNVTEEFAINNTTADITLDMAGFTLNGNIQPSEANLTIKNGTINNENASYSAIEINAGTLVLNDVKVTSKRHGVRIDGAVTATIEGGEYRLSATSGTRHAVNVSGAANVTIKAGTFVGPKGTSMDSGSAVCVQSGATVTIEGGDFSGGKTATLGVSGTMIVKGGTFDQVVNASHLAEGYVCQMNADNKYEVFFAVAKIGETYYETIQEAVDAAVVGDNAIQLLANIDGDVRVSQQEGVNITINGKISDTENYQFNGTVFVDGNSRSTGTETLTIQNINFYTADDSRDFISCNDGGNAVIRYAHNVTVRNCNFTATETSNAVLAMRFRQTYNIRVEGGNFKNLHSVMWATGVTGITVNGIVAENCKEGGLSLGTSTDLKVENVDIEGKLYGIRLGGNNNSTEILGGTLTVTGSKIKAKTPVLARNANSATTFTFNGTNVMTEENDANDYWCIICDGGYNGEETPTYPLGQVTVVLNGAGLSYDGVYGNYGVAKIGDVVYTTFNDAYNAATANQTITLLDNITLTETMTIEKAITLDLGTKTVTGADGAIVFNVKAATTIKNGTVIGNKSGSSSGLIDIYANLDLDGVTIETSKIYALRFKAGECTATLTNCNVTGAFKGYGGSVWEIKSGVYKASSTSINDQLNGTASISDGTFYYEIAEEECAPGYVVKNNGDGTWTVEYTPAAFVDADNDGILDEDEKVYGNLEQIFNNHKEGDVHVVLTANIKSSTQVDTDADAHYYFTTNVVGGVTMDFLYEDNWNYIQKMTLGKNITLNAKHLLAWTTLNVSGTINTDYLYTLEATTTINESGVVNANTGDAKIQVKDNATFIVNGTVNTAILNVWVNDAKLIVDGANAKVNASWVDIWDGAPSVTVQNGATLDTSEDNGIIKASRGGSITVDNATLTGKIELGHNGESAGELTVTGNSTLSPITLTVVGSTVSGPENLTVTSGVNGYGVNYFNGVYSLVEIEIQETELFKGWNWFSAYVDINGEAGLTKIQSALAGNATLMKSHTAFGTYYNEEWINEGGNGLSSASVTEMYMIQMETAMTGENKMQLEGNLVNPSEHTIQLNQNWNWIGYPSNKPINLENAFNGFTPQNGDRIKSHVGFSQYYGEGSNDFGITGWWGTLENMTPGLGYMYYRAGEGTATFTYNVPADGAKSELRANITADDNYWVPATHRYANNMTMVAMLEGANADNYEVAAFVDGEVRGSARPVYVEPLDAYMFFLTIYGDEVEEMSFRCYDLATGEEYAINDRINYSVDAMLGSIEEPYMFRGTVGIGEATLSEINIYPNPTTTGREISFDATCETVEVFNTLGVKVAEYHYVDTIDAFETAGIYMIRITNNGNVQNCRVVVK